MSCNVGYTSLFTVFMLYMHIGQCCSQVKIDMLLLNMRPRPHVVKDFPTKQWLREDDGVQGNSNT